MQRVSSFSLHRALRVLAAFCRLGRTPLSGALCGVLATAGLLSPALRAQTASFTGATTPVVSGFSFPHGIARDRAGDIFVADSGNNAVEEIVAVNGMVSAASQAIPVGGGFNSPNAVAVDGAGDVFVADFGNNAVKEIVAVNGVVSAASQVIPVGSGFSDPTGVAVDSAGNVFVVEQMSSAVEEIVAVNGVVSAVSQVIPVGSGFSDPQGVAVDNSGNLFVADDGNNAVKEVVAISGGTVLLSNSFTNPTSVTVDGAGDVFVTDDAVKEIVAVNGIVSSDSQINLVGSGFAARPTGVAVDSAGDVFVSDTLNNTLKEVQLNGVNFGSVAVATTTPMQVALSFLFTSPGTIGTPAVLTQGAAGLDFTDAGTGTCTTNGSSSVYTLGSSCTVNVSFTPKAAGPRYGAAVLQNSAGVAIATVSVQGTGVGPQVALTPGTITTVAGNGTPGYSGDEGAAASGELNAPLGVAVDGAGNLYIGDYFNNRVRKVTASTGVITTVAGNGTFGFNGDGGAATNAELSGPEGLAVDGAGNLYIADHSGSRVQKVSAGTGIITTVAGNGVGGYSGDGGPAASAELNGPAGLAVDGAGNLYIADNNRVREVSAGTGIITTVAGNGTQGFSGDGGPAISATLNSPIGLAVDGAGNLYITDESNNRIREVAAGTGVITTVAGNGTQGFSGDGGMATSAELNGPAGIAVDAAGDLYIAEDQNNRIREVAAGTGVITTVAGNGTGGFSGDGEAATSAALNQPFGVALDTLGNLYIVDQENSRIREVEVTMPPTLTFATATAVGSTDTADGSQTVTVSNIGNAALMLLTPASGMNPNVTAGFTLDSTSSSSCPNTATSAVSLASGRNCTLAVDFAPITAGPIPGSLTLTDNNLNASAPNYAMQTIMLSGTGSSVPLTAATVLFSTTLTPNYATTFTPVTGAGGTAPLSYSVAPALPAGLSLSSSTGTISGTPTAASAMTTYTVTVTDASSATATATFILTVNKTTPAITWAAPAAITYGTLLSATQLDATATALEAVQDVTPARGPRSARIQDPIPAPVPGTFTYTPAAGTMLPAGTQTLSVTFTPTDTTNYATATASVMLTVNKATPTITWATPATITAGTALSAVQLDATATVPGTFTYTPAVGTMLQAGNQPLSVTFTPTDTTDYATATATVTLQVTAAAPPATPVTPTLTFAPIASQMYGNAPLTVSATSASNGAVTYTVVSGPATVASNLVTLTGVGTVVLSASQAASGNYTAATASTSFTVTTGFTITAGSGAGTGSGGSVASATTVPGGAVTYTLTMAPTGTVYPDAVVFSATGLPAGATAIFSPAMIPANSPVAPFTLTIQTGNSQSNVQTAWSEKPSSGLPLAPVALGFLLLPLTGLKRFRQMPRLFVALFAAALSLGAVLGLSGCGGGNSLLNQPAQSYTVKVIATDMKTGAAASTNVTLTVQ
jgi:trimeric autotransporter adhesin